MQKLIKLPDNHYIVVDDSETPKKSYEGFYYVHGNIFHTDKTLLQTGCKIITHSTQPLEYKYGSQKQGFNMGVMSSIVELVFDKIKPLSLLEVEEAIYGYSVITLSDEHRKLEQEAGRTLEGSICSKYGYMAGFKAHKELTKDKLFTIDDMQEAFNEGVGYGMSEGVSFDKYKKSILPKTEWDIEFVNGKIKLI